MYVQSFSTHIYIHTHIQVKWHFQSQTRVSNTHTHTHTHTHTYRYQMAAANRNFNSNLGTEIVTLSVTDQGFSGSDPTGQYDGSNAESAISFVITIEPVNNAPEITVPRPEDPIPAKQNSAGQLALVAEKPGLDVLDRDSSECGGKIVMKLDVKYGALSVVTIQQPGNVALPPASQDRMEFYADYNGLESQ